MKLDRNISAGPHNGKYALLKLRRMRELETTHPETNGQINDALAVLARHGILDWGETQDAEFFVVRLKDRYAQAGLRSYATEALVDENDEYANEVFKLAERSGPHHPNCKRPD